MAPQALISRPALLAAAWLLVLPSGLSPSGLSPSVAVAAASSGCTLPTIHLPLGNCTFSAPNQTDVDSYGILTGVGPATEVCLVPSVLVNATLLTSSELCAPEWLQPNTTAAVCRSRRGGWINRADLAAASTDGLADANPGWVDIMKTDTDVAFPYAVNAVLQIRDASVTFVEGAISAGQQHTTGHLGLAEKSAFLQALKDADLIAARSWGLNSGSQSDRSPRGGSLVLGGYDEGSIEGRFYNYTIARSKLKGRPCPLQVALTGLTLRVSNGNGTVATRDWPTRANELNVCLEPHVTL